MLCLLVNFQSIGLEELFITEVTLKRQTPLVSLHVIMHRILPLLCYSTVGAYIVSIGIFLIGIRHYL